MRRLLLATFALAVSSTLTSTAGPQEEVADRLQSQSGSSSRAAPETVGMVAYAATNPERQRLEVYRIRTDGSHRRQLTTTGGYNPVWSPDDTRIAFQRREAIWLMDASGGSQQRLVEGSSPAWAPDGRRLSYSCTDGSDLCVVDLQNRTETVVVTHTDAWPYAGSSTWSPDGTWIAFTRTSAEGDDYTSDRQLFRVRADGAELTAIPNTDPLATLPAWSPDGATILYTERYDGRGGEFSGDLWSIRPDGTGKTQVTRSQGNDQAATWSPDG
jgi:TolB protein